MPILCSRDPFPHVSTEVQSSWNVILTGSTGQLGSYILHTLSGLSHVTTITCLNRSADAKERQVEIQKKRGLDLDHNKHNKATFLKTDLSKPMLDLCQSDYENLLHNATHIIREFFPSGNLTKQSTQDSVPHIPTEPVATRQPMARQLPPPIINLRTANPWRLQSCLVRSSIQKQCLFSIHLKRSRCSRMAQAGHARPRRSIGRLEYLTEQW